MNQDEKNYIASRYHDYNDCLPQHRQPEKAAAIKQLMDYFGIEEVKQHRSTNHTFESNGVQVCLTGLGEELYSQYRPSDNDLTEMALDELEQEAARLSRWEDDLRAAGKIAEADALARKIDEVEDMIAGMEEE